MGGVLGDCGTYLMAVFFDDEPSTPTGKDHRRVGLGYRHGAGCHRQDAAPFQDGTVGR